MERIRRAGFATAVAIALVTVLLPAGVLAARQVSVANRDDDSVSAAPSPTTTTTSVAPEGSGNIVPPLPDTTTAVTAPTAPKPGIPTTVTTKPKVTAPTVPAGTYAPAQYKDPDIAFVPYSSGQSSWTVTKNGVTLSLRIEPTAPRAGEEIKFFAEATSPDQPCCSAGIVYGDSISDQRDSSWSCPGGGPSAAGTRRWVFTHTYNLPGPKEFLFSAGTGNCSVAPKVAALQGWLDVAPGARPTTQGPVLPTVKVSRGMPVAGHENDRTYASLAGDAYDQDGYLARVVIDWGDGSRDSLKNTMGCTPGTGGWPVSFGTRMFIPPHGTSQPEHHYAQPGTYQVTVTAYSTGCGGLDEQSGAISFPWHATPPTAS